MKSEIKIQLKIRKNIKTMISFGLVVVFLWVGSFGSKGVVIKKDVFAAGTELTEAEMKKQEEAQAEAKDKIHDLKKDIKKIEKSKQADVQAATAIKGGINELSRNITNIQGQINRTEDSLEKLKKGIKKREEDIVTGKKRMAAVIRRMNRQKIDVKMIILDHNKGLREYIKSRDTMEGLQRSILDNLNELKEQRRNLEKAKEEKDEARDALDSQKSGLEREKVKKSWLLGEKNKEISKQDAKIKGIQRKIDKLNSALSSFLGKSFNAKDIVEAVKFASKKTGVRKEFLMAMLDKETDLGRFTGGCTYKNKRTSAIQFRKQSLQGLY